MIICRYCGSERPPVFTSSDNVVYVRFRSDSSVSHEGFSAHYITFNHSTCESSRNSLNEPSFWPVKTFLALYFCLPFSYGAELVHRLKHLEANVPTFHWYKNHELVVSLLLRQLFASNLQPNNLGAIESHRYLYSSCRVWRWEKNATRSYHISKLSS